MDLPRIASGLVYKQKIFAGRRRSAALYLPVSLTLCDQVSHSTYMYLMLVNQPC